MKDLIKFEFIKFFKNKKIFLSLVVFGVFIFVFSYFYAKVLNLKSGFSIVAHVLNFVYPFMSFISAIIGALVLSSEYDHGTIYTIFTGKISKIRFLTVKTAFIFLVSAIFVFEIVFPSIVSASLVGGFKGIKMGGYTVVSGSSLWLILLETVISIIISTFAFATLGFLIAVIVRFTSNSVVLSFVFVFLINIFTVIPVINRFIFTTYTYNAIDYFSKAASGMLMLNSWILKSIVIHSLYVVIFLSGSYKIFRNRREI